MHLKILFVSAEVSPFAKVGGLADVAGSLPRELRRLGHDVRIAMPLYSMIDNDPRWDLEGVAEDVPVALNGDWLERATIKCADASGVPIYLIGHERFFRNATSSDKIYTPGIEQYLFLSSAVLELPHLLSWTPDVIHCNDWHTGFVPVLMREKQQSRFDGTGAVFTIHNLAYQGEFGPEILDALALPRSLYVPEFLETWGSVNFLKAGCVYSDQVNTVSPTYAREIQSPEYGCKLEGLMRYLDEEGRLSGILNGIDMEFFSPESDPFIAELFSASNPAGKAACRKALLDEMDIEPVAGMPLIGVVTRLSHQKGLDLLVNAAPELFRLPVQLVVQGLGDPTIVAQLRRLEQEFPSNLRFFEKFDEDLAQRIYAGSDMFIMPSKFEPCGLGQLIAMRYGTIPIVRRTGGLADTVEDDSNGFVFENLSEDELIKATERAKAAFRKPAQWRKLVRQAMTSDHSWRRSANQYAALYERAIAAETEDVLKLA